MTESSKESPKNPGEAMKQFSDSIIGSILENCLKGMKEALEHPDTPRVDDPHYNKQK